MTTLSPTLSTPATLREVKASPLKTSSRSDAASQRRSLDLFACLSLTRLTAWLMTTRLIAAAAGLYSALLGERVTLRQTVFYLYAQILAVATLAPIPWPMGWRACWLILFCLSVRETRRGEKCTAPHGL